ncbi:MAG: 2-C-methyl-D-erythritol 4-phosphate cytidylyltransferase, partial [Gemmatimonadales bacterium]
DAAYARLAAPSPAREAAPTDDAEVCERAGFPVDVVTDSPHNVKVATADDFQFAEALARELR